MLYISTVEDKVLNTIIASQFPSFHYLLWYFPTHLPIIYM
jgi:hypothetical protein